MPWVSRAVGPACGQQSGMVPRCVACPTPPPCVHAPTSPAPPLSRAPLPLRSVEHLLPERLAERRLRRLEVARVLDRQHQVVAVDLVPRVDEDPLHDARAGGGDRRLHLHRREGDDLVALVDHVARLDLDVDDDAGHRGAHRPGLVGDSLLRAARGGLDRGVRHLQEPALAVELHDHPPRALLVRLADGHELDDHGAALVHVDGHLLPLLERVEEILGRELGHVAVDGLEVHPVGEHLRVERVGEHVLLRDLGLAVLALEHRLRLTKVVRLERRAWPPLDGAAPALEHVCAHRLGEAAGGDADGSLEVLDDRAWQR
mmetsp:Transcript_27292/g.46733  ORF Transcript_27292/g.46733 Transcript_27292/m.46733 type:complete len:316 (-) Transcript_27292:2918-3865(-)